MKLKPGVTTTEFWLSVLVIVVQGALVLLEKIDETWAAASIGVLGVVYTILRTAMKNKALGNGQEPVELLPPDDRKGTGAN